MWHFLATAQPVLGAGMVGKGVGGCGCWACVWFSSWMEAGTGHMDGCRWVLLGVVEIYAVGWYWMALGGVEQCWMLLGSNIRRHPTPPNSMSNSIQQWPTAQQYSLPPHTCVSHTEHIARVALEGTRPRLLLLRQALWCRAAVGCCRAMLAAAGCRWLLLGAAGCRWVAWCLELHWMLLDGVGWHWVVLGGVGQSCAGWRWVPLGCSPSHRLLDLAPRTRGSAHTCTG